MSLQTMFRQEHLCSPTQFLPGRKYVPLSNCCLQWHLFTVNDFEPQSSCEPMSRLEYYMTGCHAVVFAASVFCLASFFFFSHRWTSRGYAVHFVTRRERSMYSQGTITGTSDARNEIVRQVPHHRDSYNTKMRTRTGRISCIERAGILAYYKKSVVASLSK